MNRLKLLLKNFFVYGFGGIISKLVPLIMVPIITRLMPDTFYFGISDLSNTLISLFSALAVMGMYDAMYRLFFEKDDIQFKREVCSSAFSFTLLTSIIVSALMLILNVPLSKLFYSDFKYGNLVMLCALSVLIGSTNSIISAPTRMENKWKVFLVTNTLSPVISYSIAIPLLMNGYYLIALPLATLISSLTLEISFYVMNRKRFKIRDTHRSHIKDMLKIALPLLPNFIIYWIFNSSDRLMISNILGVDAAGVYAVGAKFGQISQLVYLAFAGGWQYFAFSIMKDKDNIKVISKVFSFLTLLSLMITIYMTGISDPLIKLLFEEQYWGAYISIPYLFMSPLLLMLFQIGTNQFLVIKKTWPNLLILSLGAVLNIVLNYFLIPVLGIEGASIGTIVGYVISVLLCVIVLVKMKLLEINWKIIFTFILFICSFVIMRIFDFNTWYVNLSTCLAFTIIAMMVYYKEIGKLVVTVKGLLRKKDEVQVNDNE